MYTEKMDAYLEIVGDFYSTCNMCTTSRYFSVKPGCTYIYH